MTLLFQHCSNCRHDSTQDILIFGVAGFCVLWLILLYNKPAARERRRQMYGDDSFKTMLKNIFKSK